MTQWLRPPDPDEWVAYNHLNELQEVIQGATGLSEGNSEASSA